MVEKIHALTAKRQIDRRTAGTATETCLNIVDSLVNAVTTTLHALRQDRLVLIET